ncbi:MAG: zinc-binding dehydrogenase [Verrucomicrobia bacterium]|nr:zinc-binding dehydrogenase [Verrucomicrobiota bacterium]
MKRVVVRRLGDPAVLELEDAVPGEPGAGAVRVRLSRVGVNFADTERRRGVYEAVELPWVPGTEGAGVVEAVGAGVPTDWLGRRVSVLAHPSECSGTYAEWVLCPADRLIRLPEDVSFTTGAAFPMQGLTAYGVVTTAARVQAGETVLIHAAAGGVGQWAVQIALARGAQVLAVVSHASKAAALADYGVQTLVLDGSLPDEVRAATAGRGVNVVLDSVGAPTQAASLAVLAPFGRLVYYGAAGGDPAPLAVDALYGRSLSVSAYWIWTACSAGWEPAASALLALLREGRVRAVKSELFPLAQAAEAHRRLESRAVTGKVLLENGWG